MMTTKTRGTAMVEYAVLLLATSLVAVFFLRSLGHRAGFSAVHADSVMAMPSAKTTERVERIETREARETSERRQRRAKPGVSQ